MDLVVMFSSEMGGIGADENGRAHQRRRRRLRGD